MLVKNIYQEFLYLNSTFYFTLQNADEQSLSLHIYNFLC